MTAAIDNEDVHRKLCVIEAREGWRGINGGELWRYRELVYFLTWRDIKVRYKQTVLGAAWAIIQPVMTMIVFVILFGKMGRMEEDVNTNFALFVYAALLPWQFFSNAVTQSGQSLVTGANLISKVYFPRLIMPMAAVGAGLVDFAISFCVMIVLMLAMGSLPTITVLALPLFLAGLLITSIGVGCLLSALTVAYRDFRYVVPFLVQMWMFASPVGYPLSKVPEQYHLVYSLNPLVGLIGGFRWALLGEPLNPLCLAISTTVGIIFLVVGATYFRKVERRFADIV